MQIDQTVVDRVTENFEFLKEYSANKIIYGVNKGFNPTVWYKIQDLEGIQLQYNLELLKVQDRVSSKTKKKCNAIREIVPIFTEDVVICPRVNKVKDFITNH